MKTEPRGADEAKGKVRVAVVGPCSAGKSMLLPHLVAAGYDAVQPAQEHSLIPDMWQKMTQPDLLVYLDVSYQEARRRRPHIDGGPARLADQHGRLQHAREHCDLYLDTSSLTPEEVCRAVLNFLELETPASRK